MPRKRDDVVAALSSKGFEVDNRNDHIKLFYVQLDGRKTAIRTKISRGSSHRDISDDNLSKMARQVNLPRPRFLALIDCTLNQQGYEAEVQPG